jgi:hypothetical protein
MQCIVKRSDFSVFFFSLMRENGLLEGLSNIFEHSSAPYNFKNQLRARLTYIKMFNYNPRCSNQ